MEKFAYDAFICHSSKDKEVAEYLATRLKSDGIEVWYDDWKLLAGDPISIHIDHALTDSRVLIFCMSNASMKSEWAQFEQHVHRFRDPLNKVRRFVPILIEDCSIGDSLAQFKYIDWRERAESEYLKLLTALTPEATSTKSTNNELLRASLPELLKKSFEYIVDRKVHPSLRSNTSMHFYGINFSEAKPILLPTAGVQAIGTELEHLDQVIWGGFHNPGKSDRKLQIADELVDMVRDLFILAIANGFEHWDEFDWLGPLETGYSKGLKDLSLHISNMNVNYRELLALSQSEGLKKNKLREWLTRMTECISGVAVSCELTLNDLEIDLRQRLCEDRNSPDSTGKNNSHPFLKYGVFSICKCGIPDYPGSYRQLLRRIHECGFDIWASASRTIIYGEEASAMVAIAFGGDEAPADCDIDERLVSLKESRLFESPGRFKPNRLLLSFEERVRRRFHALHEGMLFEKVSEALAIFWRMQLESVSHLVK